MNDLGLLADIIQLEPVQTEGSLNRYQMEKFSRKQDWDTLRDEIFQCYDTEEVPESLNCNLCQKTADKIYRCCDCCPWQKLCIDCLLQRHSYPHLHTFEEFKEKAFIECITDTPVWRICHSCDTKYQKSIILIDDKGKQHQRILEFCKCEREAITLTRYKFWPSSVRCPAIAFSFDLMKWMESLLVESHVSLKSFCEALKALTSKRSRTNTDFKVNDIYKILVNETFEEFRYFHYKCEHPFDGGTDCPACFSASKKIFCFDADFQLVRKVSAGEKWSEPKQKGNFFLDQKEVDDFLDAYSNDKGAKKENCNDFQAGNNLRSKNKNTKLDEKAVFGSTCRHGFPKNFFSLKHGERLGYAVFLIRKLIEEHGSEKNLFIMYDIACMLYRHLKNHDQKTLQQIILSIPIFHAYGHKAPCQILYSPRRVKGLGLTDGECVERLWAYLGKFARITKENNPEKRIDNLVYGLLHYGSKIIDKLGSILPQKLFKAQDLEAISMKALDELLLPLTDVTDDDVLKWIEEEKKESVEKSSKKKEQLSTKDHVVHLIKQHCAERQFLLELMKKYARGQQIAIRLSKQIKACNTKIKDALPTYNQLHDTKKTFKDIINQDELEHNNIKQKACNLRLIIERSREEQLMLKEEMISTYQYFECQFSRLQDKLIETNSAYREATIFKEGLYLEIKLASLHVQFNKYVDLKECSPFFSLALSYTIKEIEFCNNICADDDDDDDDDNDDNDDDDDDDVVNYGD